MTITFPELPNYSNQLMLLNDSIRLRTSSRSIAAFFRNRNVSVDYESLFDEKSKSNVWDMFQAMFVLGEDYIKIKYSKN